MPSDALTARDTFAASLRKIRKEQELSGESLAAKAAISRNTVFLIENRSANARIETIAALSAALGVYPCTFFETARLPSQPAERLKSFRRLVAANIQTQRKKKDISQNGLTKLAGLPKGYVSQIERKAPDLTLDVLDQIAKALNIDVVQLLKPALQ